MMNYLKRLIPGLLLFSLLGGTAVAQTRIATVDLGRAFTNYWKTKQADAALQDRKDQLQKTDKDMMDNYQKAKDDYQKLLADANNQTLSTEERDKRKKAAEDKLKDLKDQEKSIADFEREARARLSEQSMRMRDNLLSELRDAVNAKAKAGNFDLVLDTSAQSVDHTPIIVFSSANNDITESVISQLNANAPIEPASGASTNKSK